MLRTDITNYIVSVIKETSPILTDTNEYQNTEISLKDTFLVDLGINSIDYVEIVNKVNSAFNTNIPLSRFSSTNNIGEIVSIVSKEIESTNKPLHEKNACIP